MKRAAFPIFAILLTMLAAGCIRTDYIGQEFPDRRHGAVQFFPEQEKVPAGEFLVMGRLLLKAPNGTDGYDIQDKLIAEAGKRGADAVVLFSSHKKKVGFMPNSGNEMRAAESQRRAGRVSAGGGLPDIENAFDKPVKFGGNRMIREEVHVRALLLIRKEDFEAIRQDHPEEAEPLFMKKDPSGQPVRFPKAAADLPEKKSPSPAEKMPGDDTLFSENTTPFPEAMPDSL